MGNVKLLIILAVCNSLSPLALQMLAPALPSIRLTLNATLAQTQTVLSAYSIALALSMLVYGPLADRFDRKHLLIFGMLTFSVGSLVGYFADTIEILVIGRILQAIGAGAASTITRAIVADTYQGDDLNRAMSVMLMIVVIGPMLSPVLGGYIVDQSSWSNIMGVLCLMGVLLAIVVTFLLKNSILSSEYTGTVSTYWRGFEDVVRNRGFINNMTILMAIQIGVYAFISASPYLIIDVLGYTASQYGVVFVYLAAGYIAGNFVSSLVVKKIGGKNLVFLATFIYLLGAALFIGFVVFDIQNLATIAGPALLLTFTNGITQPNCGAGALASVAGKKGVVASLSGFGQIMAGALGFQIMGFLGTSSANPLAVVLGICSVLAVVAAALLLRSKERVVDLS